MPDFNKPGWIIAGVCLGIVLLVATITTLVLLAVPGDRPASTQSLPRGYERIHVQDGGIDETIITLCDGNVRLYLSTAGVARTLAAVPGQGC